ncbi:MAG TPA: extracellular solute-binding protein [Acetobacteraceae bacterium]|nr:extracellular solute-binding protein [Acetobacteraceae bacterium]
MSELTLTRRAALAGAAATPLLGRAARAEEQVVIATWGGDYANLLKNNIDDPLVKKLGITVVQDTDQEDERVAKMIAQRRLPRGGRDVICLQAVRAYETDGLGLLDTIDEAKVPNMKHVRPDLKTSFYAPHIFSPQVLIYNPDKVKEPPQTLTDLLDPKWKGKVGVGDVNYFYVMMAAALSATGDPNKVDAEETKQLIIKLNGNGLRLYPTTDSIGAGVKSGEIEVGLMWLARVNMWQNAGIPVKASFQKEGCVLYVSGMVVPKNAGNKEGAYKYLNAMLQPQAQEAFAEKMGYLPTVQNAPLSGKVGEQLALPVDLKLIPPDYSIVGKLQSTTSEWWKKTMKS